MTLRLWGRPRAARIAAKAWIGASALVVATALGIEGTQDAVANGDTRSVTVHHTHSKESATITFRRNGSYDADGLKQLNWILRDWRTDEQTRMEPRLFDILWEVYREVGSDAPVQVVSAYRAPQTNAMLRRRSRAVAEHSQHMAGRAMDFHIPDVSMTRVREVAMRLQRGGVGFYPNSLNSFVHLDAGSVRSWPRMSSDQLARLFPDGRTVHLPRDGRPLAGYETAKAEILARGGSVAGLTYAEAGEEATGRKSLWATLFGGGDDEDSDFYRSPASRAPAASRGSSRVASLQNAASSGNSEDGGMRGAIRPAEPRPEPASARSRRGRTEVAALDQPLAAAAIPTGAAPGFELNQPPAPAAASFAPPPGPATVAMPMPPRRPEEFGLLVAAPVPPARPILLAGLEASRPARAPDGQASGSGRPGPAYGAPAWAASDDRAALKALFDAAAPRTALPRRADVTTARTRSAPVGPALRLDDNGAKVRMAFSTASDDIAAGAFRGAAVVALPTLP